MTSAPPAHSEVLWYDEAAGRWWRGSFRTLLPRDPSMAAVIRRGDNERVLVPLADLEQDDPA